MARQHINTKFFYTVPGVLDEKGQTARFDSPPTVVPDPAKKGETRQVNPSEVVQHQEDLYDNGDAVVSRYDPQKKDWVQEDVQTDAGRAASYNTAADNARADAAASAAKAPQPQTPEEAALTAAQTDLARGQLAGLNPTVQRPAGADARRDVPNATETVSKVQADYDRQLGEDKRQAALDLQKRMQDAEQSAHNAAILGIEQQKWTHQQALDEFNKSIEKIRLQGEAEMRALTQRGQDVQVRGQDVSAGVTQRGQDVDFQRAAGDAASANWRAVMPYWNAPGQIESYNSLMKGGPPVATQPAQLPFNPSTVFMQGAQAAQAGMPGQFQLPGAPPPVQPGQYTMPG